MIMMCHLPSPSVPGNDTGPSAAGLCHVRDVLPELLRCYELATYSGGGAPCVATLGERATAVETGAVFC